MSLPYLVRAGLIFFSVFCCDGGHMDITVASEWFFFGSLYWFIVSYDSAMVVLQQNSQSAIEKSRLKQQ